MISVIVIDLQLYAAW